MSFPFEFAKKSGDYDFVSPLINFTGNAGVIGVASIGLGAIANIAFKALGFSSIATGIATAIPVTVGIAGIGATIIGGICVAAIVIEIAKAYGRR